MPRVRTVIFGGMVGGALSLLLAPRLGGVRRGPLARFKPLAVLDRRALAQFAGTPCSSRRDRVDPGEAERVEAGQSSSMAVSSQS